MEWAGLVGHVEHDLERSISQGLFPKDGFLPSEHSLAKYYGVSRTTVREALRRLAARDLIVQHPGRRSRAVALDEAVTLENLSMVLNREGPIAPERLRLLEGFLALKRDTAVELLVACCEQASARDLDELQATCFALMDSAHWQPAPERWVTLEFDLLRVAARTADRPGQALLLQSLERSYRAMARHLLPHVNAASMRQWAHCAFQCLGEKDIPRLRQQLPVLLQAADELLLKSLAPSPEPDVPPLPFSPADESPPARGLEPEAPPPVSSPPAMADAPVSPDPSAQDSGAAPDSPAAGDDVSAHSPGLGTPGVGGRTGPVSANLSACRTGWCEARPTGPLPPAPQSAGLDAPEDATTPQKPTSMEFKGRGGICPG